MENEAVIDKRRPLFKLIKETSIKIPGVSETISEKDGTIIHSQSRRFNRWVERFREQFNWYSVVLQLSIISKQSEWRINEGPPALSVIEIAIRKLR